MRTSTHAGRRSSGFSLLEMLLVLGIISIVAAIAIPTLLNALDRGRQARSMATLRSIGSGLEAYQLDNNVYPAGSGMTLLAAAIEGDYVKALQPTDAWSHPLIYTATLASYTLGSTGKEGGGTLTMDGGGGPTRSFEADIIYSQGQFVQWPEGMQQ